MKSERALVDLVEYRSFPIFVCLGVSTYCSGMLVCGCSDDDGYRFGLVRVREFYKFVVACRFDEWLFKVS